MQTLFSYKRIYQPFAMMNNSMHMKLLQYSLQSRGTVLLKDLAIQLDGIGTVPLSTLTTSSFSINIGELQDQQKLQVYDSFIAKNCKSVDVGNYVSYSEDGTEVRTPRTLNLQCIITFYAAETVR